MKKTHGLISYATALKSGRFVTSAEAVAATGQSKANIRNLALVKKCVDYTIDPIFGYRLYRLDQIPKIDRWDYTAFTQSDMEAISVPWVVRKRMAMDKKKRWTRQELKDALAFVIAEKAMTYAEHSRAQLLTDCAAVLKKLAEND